MAHTSSIFDSQPIRVQNVNGFDLSHLNSGTAKCGQLTPVLCRLLMQGTKFSLGCSVQVELPPLSTSFFGRIDCHIEVFFVSCSILYGGWKQFIVGNITSQLTGPTSSLAADYDSGFKLPVFSMNLAISGVVGGLEATNDGLLDYMGFRFTSALTGSARYFNLLPLIAYHRIWDCFFRNPSVTRTIFAVNPNAASNLNYNVKNVSLVWHSFYTSSVNASYSEVFSDAASTTFPDGISVFSMRQRNYPRDYFTAASVSPQQPGAPTPTLDFTIDVGQGTGAFTLPSLRALNSLAKFYEAGNYDPSYKGAMRAHFGTAPSDADRDEPIYIGRLVVPVYQKSVYNSNGDGQAQSQNPYAGQLAGRGSHATFTGEGSITSSFTAGCFGYLIGIFSLVPHANYAYGIEKHWDCVNLGDFPFPELQSVGMDAIKKSEIYAEGGLPAGDFAYIPRYSYWKYVDDSVHGELRPGKSLDSFVLQRRFSQTPTFGTSFLEIPQNALDSVFAVSVEESHFSCWYEVFWVFKAVMPLAAFCVPTLGDLQDTHTIKTTQGGSRL